MRQKPLQLEERHVSNDPDPLYVTVPPPEFINKSQAEDILDEAHQRAFSHAVMKIIRTSIAEETFAQIVDGLPLKHVMLRSRASQIIDEDPVSSHTDLCPGVLEKIRGFRAEFNPGGLEVPLTVLQRYQNTPVGSKVSKMPFVELVAVAIHSIAVELFKLDTSVHKDVVWPSEEIYRQNNWLKRWSTPFSVVSYTKTHQFPDGPADAAGYWAEDRIFGGVVLFGRGDDGTGYDGVWFHSHRVEVTRRIYALTEDQIGSLLQFLEKETVAADVSAAPLPILGDSNNRRRVDPEIAMPEFNVYRDRWERTVDSKNWLTYRPPHNCRHAFDYPELEEAQREYIESYYREQGGV